MNANGSIILQKVEFDLVPSVGVSYSSGTEWDVYRERLYRFIAEEMIWHVPAYTA